MKTFGRPQGGMDIGVRYGRNLALNSEINISTTNYHMVTVRLAEELKIGETYTVTIYGQLDESIKQSNIPTFRLFNTTGSGDGLRKPATFPLPARLAFEKMKENIYTFTTTITSDLPSKSTKSVVIHQGGKPSINPSTIERVKFEKGSIPTPWTPAPEDLKTAEEKIDHLLKLYYGGY